MASVSLKLLLVLSASLLLGAASAQELFEDEPIYEQYSPVLGENFIDYPMLEEYGVPTVEEFPDEDPEEDGEGDQQEESDSTETEDKDKKEVIKHTDNEYAQTTSSVLNSKNDAREKRQLPLQDDPAEIAQEKLQRAIKAAQALSGIENELGLDPSTVENKTANLESELKSEEKNFKKLADDTQDSMKKAKFVKLEKDADEDVNKAENILKLIVKLEAAKFLAKERAQKDLEEAEKRKLASNPAMILGQPLSYPPQAPGYYAGVQQSTYKPVMQSYTTNYPTQMFQGIRPPSMTSAPSTMLSPASFTGQASATPPYQPAYQDDTEIQRINAIKATQASASVVPPQGSHQTAEATEPMTDKVASFSSESGNNDINPGDIDFNDLSKPSPPKKPVVTTTTPPAQAQATDHKHPQAHATPQQTNKDTASAVSFPPASQPAQLVGPAQPVVPIQPVAPVQPVSPPMQTIESAFRQSNGFMSQAEPLTASYNPSISPPSLSPVSSFFDSSHKSPNPFTAQSFNQPMPNQQTLEQSFASPVQSKTPALKAPELVKPVANPFIPAFNDQSQTLPPPSSAKLKSQTPAAFSGEQALSGAYPFNSFHSWNTQALSSTAPQYAWNAPSLYPAPAQYQAPVNPLIAEAYRKLHATERASLAMSKIEEAIGLSPSSVRHIIDDIENQAKQEESHYEEDMSKEKVEINKEKALLQNDKVSDGEVTKKKIQEDENKLRDDIRKENVAKLETEKIKKIEKILTIIEAAKYSAMQRAKKRINKLGKGADEGLDGDDIRKRDLEDLERDIRRRRRNEINIWLKGSRNHIDTSHFLRNHLGRLQKHSEEGSRWDSDGKKIFDHSQSQKHSESAVGEFSKESGLHKLKFFKTLVSNKTLEAEKQSAMEKRTEVPEKPKKFVDTFIVAKLMEKMDKLFKIQEDILKYLKAEHDIHRLEKKKPARRWRRSLHYLKHYKKIHKHVKRSKSLKAY